MTKYSDTYQTNPEIIKKIKMRLSKGISVAEAAAELGLSKSTVYKYKNLDVEAPEEQPKPKVRKIKRLPQPRPLSDIPEITIPTPTTQLSASLSQTIAMIDQAIRLEETKIAQLKAARAILINVIPSVPGSRQKHIFKPKPAETQSEEKSDVSTNHMPEEPKTEEPETSG